MLLSESSNHTSGNPTPVATRLTKYGVAALSAAAVGIAANSSEAAQVTLPVNISSSNSIERFVDIQPFALGANTISAIVATSSLSYANPLAPNSELMLRGAANIAQLRPNNGALIAAFISSSFVYVRNVGAAFALPPNNAGTFMTAGGSGGQQYNPSLTYPAFGAGDFPIGSTRFAYFTFNNPGTGLTNGWATIVMNGTAAVPAPTITALHVDTGVPEPSSMALLCMGAVGMAAYRRRSPKAN
jgi:hypothetical protein